MGSKKKRMRLRSELYKRQECRCFWCGEFMLPVWALPHPRAVTLEHIVPRERGGTDDAGNLTVAHKRCNEARAK